MQVKISATLKSIPYTVLKVKINKNIPQGTGRGGHGSGGGGDHEAGGSGAGKAKVGGTKRVRKDGGGIKGGKKAKKGT